MSGVAVVGGDGRPSYHVGGPRRARRLSRRRRREHRRLLPPILPPGADGDVALRRGLARRRRRRGRPHSRRRRLLPPPDQHVPRSARTTVATAIDLRLPRRVNYLLAGSSSRSGGEPCGGTTGCAEMPAGVAARGARGTARSRRHLGKQIATHGTTMGRGEAVGGLRGIPSPRPRLPQSAAVTLTAVVSAMPATGHARGSPTRRRVQHGHRGRTNSQSSDADRFAPLLHLLPTSTQLQAMDSGHTDFSSHDVGERGVAATSDVPPRVMVILSRAASEMLVAVADVDGPPRVVPRGFVPILRAATVGAARTRRANDDASDPGAQ